MKRRVCSMLLTVILLVGVLIPTVEAAVLTDLRTTDWYYTEVQQMVQQGYINGYPDGTFRGEKSMSVAEFITVLCKLLNMEYGEENGYWAGKQLNAAIRMGWLDSYDLTLAPRDSQLPRQLAAKILTMALNTAGSGTDTQLPFSDQAQISATYRPYVAAAYAQGLFLGDADGNFYPYGTITRGAAATLAYRAAKKGGTTTVPEQSDPYADHVFCETRNAGSCKQLWGEVIIAFVFVDNAGDTWSETEIETFKATMARQTDNLRKEAAEYGASAQFRAIYKRGSVGRTIDMNNSSAWIDEALTTAGLPAQAQFYESMSAAYTGAQIPIVFCLPREGRSYAFSYSSGNTAEYCVVYEDCEAYMHELLHLFGAKDYYYEGTIQEAGKRYYEDSVMFDSSKTDVDSLTAYLIGWAAEPDETAESFLRATAHITKQDLEAIKEDDRQSGYGTKRYSDATYVGELHEGIRHGQGTMYWNNGDTYTGAWSMGERSGYGVYTWAGGGRYEGYWLNGDCEGQGTRYLNNGDTYTGAWSAGKRSGYGVYTWAGGGRYEGYWLNDVCEGEGTRYFSNGDIYYGDWSMGNCTGYGIYIWPDGSWYEGNWYNNKQEGYGTYTRADGVTVSGTWSDGKYVQ